MGDDESAKYPTWKWVLTIAIALIAFLSVQGLSSINAQIDGKVDKSVYEAEKARDRADIKEIKSMVTCIYNSYLPENMRKASK